MLLALGLRRAARPGRGAVLAGGEPNHVLGDLEHPVVPARLRLDQAGVAAVVVHEHARLPLALHAPHRRGHALGQVGGAADRPLAPLLHRRVAVLGVPPELGHGQVAGGLLLGGRAVLAGVGRRRPADRRPALQLAQHRPEVVEHERRQRARAGPPPPASSAACARRTPRLRAPGPPPARPARPPSRGWPGRRSRTARGPGRPAPGRGPARARWSPPAPPPRRAARRRGRPTRARRGGPRSARESGSLPSRSEYRRAPVPNLMAGDLAICLIAAVLLLINGYIGYSGVLLAVGAAAAVNLALSSGASAASCGSRWMSTSAPRTRSPIARCSSCEISCARRSEVPCAELDVQVHVAAAAGPAGAQLVEAHDLGRAVAPRSPRARRRARRRAAPRPPAPGSSG